MNLFDGITLFDVFHGKIRERILIQRLIVVARLSHDLTERTELGGHYEKLNFQLQKQYRWDHITGLLLIYPTCLLHIIEVLNADQCPRREEDEEETTESLVCSVLTALQTLGKHLEISKETLPGSLLDDDPELIISQEVLLQLLAQEELQSPQQYLQSYDSPLNIRMEFGERQLIVHLGF
ncbi:hypothetical protein LDENG_00158780 [Lucifuga dentata]|nr:hypothetical protein LDENG_00158780 [Lucifuga dentata]